MCTSDERSMWRRLAEVVLDGRGVVGTRACAGFALALAVAVACTPRSVASAQADAFGRDKLLHFGVSAGLTLGGFAALRVLELPPAQALPLSIAGALAIGLAKEALDAAVRGGFSAADLAWDWLGIVSATCVAALLTRWLWPPLPAPAAGDALAAARRDRGSRWGATSS